jgi:lipooligosaccharide transport system permease protein
MSEASAPPTPGRREQARPDHTPPSRATRLRAVVRRHWVVYASTFTANALPAFMEPILFLAAIGLGLGSYVGEAMGEGPGLPLGAFMGPGALAMTAMFTAAFETSYGTFVRMVYQKTYDGMLATPLTPNDVFLGELLFCGLKGAGFTSVVMAVFFGFALARGWVEHLQWTATLVPIVGFCCSFAFGAIALHVTSVVKNMANFNFFITGALTPMSLFSGMVFPVGDLPAGLREVAYALPLFHVTELNRLLMFGPEACVSFVWASPVYLVVVTALLTWSALRRMRKRVLQ